MIEKDEIDLSRPIFYVASKGHHADIGGISPGSMPSFSTHLAEEGFQTLSFKIVGKLPGNNKKMASFKKQRSEKC